MQYDFDVQEGFVSVQGATERRRSAVTRTGCSVLAGRGCGGAAETSGGASAREIVALPPRQVAPPALDEIAALPQRRVLTKSMLHRRLAGTVSKESLLQGGLAALLQGRLESPPQGWVAEEGSLGGTPVTRRLLGGVVVVLLGMGSI